METIKQYLESLFINMPNTSEVQKAKAHLLEMAEDKYQNLISEGMSDNEAVAKVIAEFGNLDELKDDLGLDNNTIKETVADATAVSLENAKDFIHDLSTSGLLRGIGVFFFICCVVPPILMDNGFSAALMFISIAIGVALCIISSSYSKKWSYIKNTRCSIDMNTAEYVKSELRRYKTTDVTLRTISIMLFILCFVPSIFIDNDLSSALLFLMVGTGVAILIATGKRKSAMETLLRVNPENTIGATYSKGSQQIKYKNGAVATIMGIYWPLITCIYLSASFLTHAWGTTWIIWPVAAISTTLINTVWGEEE